MLVRFLAFMLMGVEVTGDVEEVLASGVCRPTVALPSLLVTGVVVPLALALAVSSSMTLSIR